MIAPVRRTNHFDRSLPTIGLQLRAQGNLSNKEATLLIVRKGRLKIKQPKKFKNREKIERRNVQISSDALEVVERSGEKFSR